MKHKIKQNIALLLAWIAVKLDLSICVNIESKEGEYNFKVLRKAHSLRNCVSIVKPESKNNGFECKINDSKI